MFSEIQINIKHRTEKIDPLHQYKNQLDIWKPTGWQWIFDEIF